MMKLNPILTFCLALIFLTATPWLNSGVLPASAAGELVVITGGSLIDGSGGAPVNDAVVVIKGDSIVAAGRRRQIKIPEGARLIDARGLVIAPGFIDTHNHSDRGFADDPSAATQVSQGITTVAVGQDGGSALPIGEYLNKLDHNPGALNVVTFVGHATLRSEVMGENTNRHATAAEIEKMKQLVEQAMRDGAFGLSTGLEYEIGKPATTEEVIALASVAGRFGGIYISHIRDEADKAFEAFAEAIRIGREGHLPAQISHIKLGTVAVWGRASEATALIEKARRRGQDVTADCYPYDAWNSTIRVLIPSGRHDDADDVARGLADVGGAQNITIVSCRAHPDYEFKTLAEIALQQNHHAGRTLYAHRARRRSINRLSFDERRRHPHFLPTALGDGQQRWRHRFAPSARRGNISPRAGPFRARAALAGVAGGGAENDLAAGVAPGPERPGPDSPGLQSRHCVV